MQVNFISEVTSFYRLTKRQHLGMNAQMLWFHLFCLWNEAGFPEWLQVDMFRMMSMIQVNNKNALIRARGELIDAGLLVSQRGVNRQPNRYQLLSVPRETGSGMGKKNPIESRCEIETTTKTATKTALEMTPETDPLYKLNHTKPKVKKEKAVFGRYGNVLLSQDELEKLQRDFPESWEYWIKRLDDGKEAKGYTYASDYAAIHNWMEKDEHDARDKAFDELMAECAIIFG